MIERIESCAAELLRRQTGHTLSLQQLHDALVEELGSAAGSYHQLHQRLKQARGLFHVLERRNPLIHDHAWPLDLHEQYTGALRDAGLDLSPLVSLPCGGDDQATSVLGRLEQTLASLRSHSASDEVLASDLLDAFTELPRLQDALERAQRPTRFLRGPGEAE